jgi:penicillin-binding protein 1B
MNQGPVKFLFKFFIALSTSLIIIFGIWVITLNKQISERLESGWFKPPVELYALPETLKLYQRLPSDTLKNWLESWAYQEIHAQENLRPGQYALLSVEACKNLSDSAFDISASSCLWLRNRPRPNQTATENYILVGFNEQNEITLLKTGSPLRDVDSIELPPQRYAQFYGDELILRQFTPLGEVPLYCLQAITAVEDAQFLSHSGVSWTGIIRAAKENLLAGRVAQGGSTITQQLVKNYFLTSERSFKRKITEALMALLLELHVNKDQIFETYINVIYLGQNGPFQIIGIGAASEHYFGKPVSELTLPECALLAAMINSPGRYNPQSHPESAVKRRQFVLSRMQEVGHISLDSVKEAQTFALPKKRARRLTEPAPYFTQSVFRELETLNLDRSAGLKIFTTLNERAQEQAQTLAQKHVEKLETNFKSLKQKKDSGKNLEVSLISIDVPTGGVKALVGGRSYQSSQFNRVLDSYRQVGSIIKPFVFLAALEGVNENGEPWSPLSILLDAPFTHKYQGQTWTPKNYDNKYYGSVPLYVALKNSLNVATVKLGLQVGLENVIEVSRRMGITAPLTAVPSLMLGAFEIRPWDLAQGYASIARLGNFTEQFNILGVETMSGKILMERKSNFTSVTPPEKAASLISMMKETFNTGTARLAKRYGFLAPAAGKTGTTSDTRDAWFVGFTPDTLTLTWVGYDDNTPTGLTGASGALPLWLDYMSAITQKDSTIDFSWPKHAQKIQLTPKEIQRLCPQCEAHELVETVLYE